MSTRGYFKLNLEKNEECDVDSVILEAYHDGINHNLPFEEQCFQVADQLCEKFCDHYKFF